MTDIEPHYCISITPHRGSDLVLCQVSESLYCVVGVTRPGHVCCGCVEERPFVSSLVQMLIRSQDSGQLKRHCAITEGDIYSHILDLVRSPEGTEFNPDGTFKTTKRTLRVTTLIKPMFPPFDAEAVASGCVARSMSSSSTSNTPAKTAQSYFKEWAIKRITGSATHAVIDLMLALYPLQTVTQCDFENEFDLEQIILEVVDKDATGCQKTHVHDNDGSDPYCDQCRFLITDRDDMCATILPYVRRLIRLSVFAVVRDILVADPDAMIIASEKSMVVPLDVMSTDPLYLVHQTQPQLLSGTADFFIWTSARISPENKWIPGTERRVLVGDWKTTQNTESSLDSLYRMGTPKDSVILPFQYMTSTTKYTEMAPTTRNKHLAQIMTYCAKAKYLFGMNCDAFICMLKYSPKSASGSGYYLSYSTDEALKSALQSAVTSLFAK